MKRTCFRVALLVGLIGSVIGAETLASPPFGRSSKTDGPPRKVIVGTVSLPLYGTQPNLTEQLKRLSGLVDEMASQAATKYSGKGLDLAILNENAVTPQHARPSETALPLD